TGAPPSTSAVTISTDPDDASLRLITFSPQIPVANWIVNFTLSDPSDPAAPTTPFTVSYLVSRATTPTSTVLQNSSDDSSAIDVGGGYFLNADDEKNNVGLYNGNASGRELAEFGRGNSTEHDLEASARKGDQV